jgi:hypothetical protein
MLMTPPETSISNWLTYKKIEFNFQSQLIGGFYNTLKDEKADFQIPESNTILRVIGTDVQKTVLSGTELINRERLESQGHTVVDLWDSDIKGNLELVMNEAIEGREI